MIPIYIISLERSRERFDSCQEALKKQGLTTAQWFPAIDGKTVDLSKYNLDRKRFQVFRHNWFSFCCRNMYFSDTEYATSLSHLTLYQKMIDENIEMALILEDDAILNEGFNDLLEHLDVVVKENDCDVLYLYYNEKFNNWFKPVDTNYGVKIQRIGAGKFDCIVNRRESVNSAAAYVITKKGAQRLIDVGYPVRTQADVLLSLFAFNKLRGFKVIPKVFRLSGLPSTILHAGDMPENVKPWYSRLAKRIKKLYHK